MGIIALLAVGVAALPRFTTARASPRPPPGFPPSTAESQPFTTTGVTMTTTGFTPESAQARHDWQHSPGAEAPTPIQNWLIGRATSATWTRQPRSA